MFKFWARISLKTKMLLCFCSIFLSIIGAIVIYVVFLQNAVEELMRPRYELMALRNRDALEPGYHGQLKKGILPAKEKYKEFSDRLKNEALRYFVLRKLYTIILDENDIYVTATSEDPSKFPPLTKITDRFSSVKKKIVNLWNSDLYFPPSVHFENGGLHTVCVLQRATDMTKFISCAEVYSTNVGPVRGMTVMLFCILTVILIVGFLPLVLLYHQMFSRKAAVLRTMVDHRTEELRKALMEAEEASKAKSQFVASVSHELRTPLNAIVGFSEMMKEEMFGPIENKNYKEYIELIYSSGVLLRDLINQILDMSKFNAGHLSLNSEWIDLAEISKEALLVISGYPDARKRQIQNDISAKIPKLWVDKSILMHLFLNILSNAVKYTQENGVIILSAEVNGKEELIIRLKDNGVGISNENLEKIFMPFFQVEGNVSKVSVGTGLGLYLVKHMVEILGGTIMVESEEGKGSTFIVVFPPEIFKERET